MRILSLLLAITLSACVEKSNFTPIGSYLNCIGVATTIILLDKDDVSKARKSTGKTLEVWEEIRGHFVKVVVAKRIATGISVKDAQLEIAQYVQAGSKIYLKAATSNGKVDMDRETFEKGIENCLLIYGM